MKFLSGSEEKEAQKWIESASKVALSASCTRAKCGSVIVKNGNIIGKGFNSPAGDNEKQRKCTTPKSSYHKKVTDKTCCVHAEQRAIMDALRKNPTGIKGSRLYFIRLDEDQKPTPAGQPYCTICSKMALDSGVAEFVLVHEEGICVYKTDEYNQLSYRYSDLD